MTPKTPRYYQSPDGTGTIKKYPFCICTTNEKGEKVYTLDEVGNRIRSVRINEDGTKYIQPKRVAHSPPQKDDFLNLRRKQKKVSHKQRKQMQAQAKAQAQEHTCSPECEHELDFSEIGESINEEE